MAISATRNHILRMRPHCAVLLATGLWLVACAPPQDAFDYDYLLRGGTVVDGTGAPQFVADVAIAGDRIAAISRDGSIDPAGARIVLDVDGLIVAPGFIDTHAHIQTEVNDRPLLENFLWQGLTTIMATLHSGDQPTPYAEFLASLEMAPNVGYFAGHTWTRKQVLGYDDRAPTADELEEMKALVRKTMEEGALGLSTGLLYVPANYAETEEVIALAKVAAEYGGIYVSHMRDEGRGLIDAVAEVIRIADEAGIPAQIQHHKAMGPAQFGWTERTLAMIDSANAAGLEVMHDLYPYTAGSTGSSVVFPPWALAGGRDSLRARLRDPDVRPRVEEGMLDRLENEWTGGDLRRIQFRTTRSMPAYDGKTLWDLARDRGLPNTDAAGIPLLIELELGGGFSAIYHVMDEADVIRVMRHPLAMFETDGDPIGYGEGFPHPRSYGAFPRVIARYVRELGVLTLEEAIHKMTEMPAVQFGQHERGTIKEMQLADVVVFDYDRIQDLATYQDPHRYSVGMVHVFVNGVPVIRNRSLTGFKPGRVLRGPARETRR